ncbi:hypothetical protein KIKIMORA_02200 [Brevundimonas phage vB_BpoS-Kikimora]|uniref:Uncharacterized protein n=1 Tax=Brevundimonas phage vB_BpoS-Kikimora TaxID=2948601 RepID=A0A9E7MTI2_9CAUD|nr:hypothetical protein KIKIMORA_02200 [Brevundimonas phage vB_BpoS-Kikimora]
MRADTIDAPIAYFPGFLDDGDALTFQHALRHDITWRPAEGYSVGMDHGEQFPSSAVISLLRSRLQHQTGQNLEACRPVRLHTGADAMDYQTDDSNSDNDRPTLMVFLGEPRPITLRTRGGINETEVMLDHGALLVLQAGAERSHEYAFWEADALEESIVLIFKGIKA